MALVPFPGPQSGALRLPPEDDEDDDFSGGKMSFLEHLDELRKRILNSVIAIAVGVVVSFFFIERLVHFVLEPTLASLPEGSHMIYTQPQEAFSRYIAVALLSGIIFAAPFIMWQVWRFIAPGLYTNEKKLAIPFVFLSTAGFVGGAAFSHFIAFPLMNRFFASFHSTELLYMPRLSDVFGLYTKMVLATGLIFQMPTVVLFLARMDMITARLSDQAVQDGRARHLRHRRRHHAGREPDGPGDHGRPDARAVRPEHPDCLDRWSKTAHGCTERRRLARPHLLDCSSNLLD